MCYRLQVKHCKVKQNTVVKHTHPEPFRLHRAVLFSISPPSLMSPTTCISLNYLGWFRSHPISLTHSWNPYPCVFAPPPPLLLFYFSQISPGLRVVKIYEKHSAHPGHASVSQSSSIRRKTLKNRCHVCLHSRQCAHLPKQEFLPVI